MLFTTPKQPRLMSLFINWGGTVFGCMCLWFLLQLQQFGKQLQPSLWNFQYRLAWYYRHATKFARMAAPCNVTRHDVCCPSTLVWKCFAYRKQHGIETAERHENTKMVRNTSFSMMHGIFVKLCPRTRTQNIQTTYTIMLCTAQNDFSAVVKEAQHYFLMTTTENNYRNTRKLQMLKQWATEHVILSKFLN